MFYKVDSLFISPAGMVTSYYKNGDRYKHIEPDGFIIIKQSPYSSSEYKDIFSNTYYKNFSDELCSPGDLSVTKPQKLTLFINKLYSDLNQSKILIKILDKIINNEKISSSDLKKFLFYLNNPDQLKIDEKNFIEQKKYNKLNLKIYTDLTKKKYKLNPIIGQKEEMKELIVSLIQNNTPILTGECGVGTTSMVEGLAYKIQKNNVPDSLKKKRIIELNMTDLLMSKENNDEKITNLIAYCIKKNIILFIDDIDKIVEYEIWNIITSAIKKKNLKVIGTTHIDNYNKYFNNDNYKQIFIDEPTELELFEIIKNRFKINKNKYNISYDITIPNFIIKLIRFTDKENRLLDTNDKIVDNKIYNPYLVIQIIDRIFIEAEINNQRKLDRRAHV